MVEAVVNAVDVSKPSAPACPLPVADPTLSKANHPATIGIDAIAEVEVLYLYLMLARYDGSNDVLVLTDGSKGRIVLDPAQRVGYTALDQCETKSHERSGLQWTRDSVRSRRHPARAQLVTEACEAAGEVQGEPEPGGQTGSGEGRTGERK